LPVSSGGGSIGTGKEFGDDFHQLWRSAEAGESEFLPIFLP
jgi:hypothetical protein